MGILIDDESSDLLISLECVEVDVVHHSCLNAFIEDRCSNPVILKKKKKSGSYMLKNYYY